MKASTLRWICVVLAVLALAAWWQGLRAARDRQAMLQPSRLQPALSLPRAEWFEVDPARSDAILLALPQDALDRPLVLNQILPERRLLRWLERDAGGGSLLLLPLRGLEAGDYWLSLASSTQRAAPEEMDRPVQELAPLLQLRILSATGSGGG